MSDWIRDSLRERDERRRAMHERIFPTPEPFEPSSKPEGDADGGKGEAPDAQIEHVQTDVGVERMEVFDLDKLMNTDKEN